MRLKARGFALGVAAGVLGLACAVAPATAQAATTGWRVYANIPVDDGQDVVELTSVAVVNAADAWAVGAAFNMVGAGPGIVLHWTGKAWSRIKLPAKVAAFWNYNGGGQAVDVVGASSASNVWAFDGGGGFIHLTSRGWTYGMVPGTADGYSFTLTVSDVDVFSATDVWIFGCSFNSGKHASAVPYAAHFNGRKWAKITMPGSGEVAGVSAVSARYMWAVTGPTYASGWLGTAKVLRWNGVNWRPIRVQPPKLPKGAAWTAIYARSHADLWVAGGGALNYTGGVTPERVYHWTGKRWLVTALPARATAPFFNMISLVPDGSGLWGLDSVVISPAVGGPGGAGQVCSTIWHLTGTKWTARPVAGGHRACLFQLASVASGKSTWAVGTPYSTAKGLIALSGPVPR